ncbi:efflux transporter outer membrane subunit [Rhodoferax antarcticus]|uniref:RND efflux system, outer membrane lipoprotein, nodT family protein n=1 Tax=Rhodoferax antarcticus ANT.BR TaxID=1111071 RepID=A0A1Q8YH42_9BURK|nr:efflux transporter outer membrane subunit [Rhodoferax antarcticus]APW45139.1 RND transporter [Rhodoferax antarcticus]OLP07374.1 RND efflux system, outer membrane lipoprotein, nodT family protein [Rhodoferax antarcticus ANT.BR]
MTIQQNTFAAVPRAPVAVHRLRIIAMASAMALGALAGCADFSGITPQSQLRDADSFGLTTPSGITSVNTSANAAENAAINVPAPLDNQWWRAFGDDTLNQLQAQALQANPSLKLAQARITAAQAAAQLTQSATGPQLNAQLSATRQRYTANGAIAPPLAGAIESSGTAQLAGSWELDFFGKNSAALQAALGNARAAQADAQAARVLLASQVGQTYFSWVGLNEQRALANRALAQHEETLQLVQDRFNAGLDTPLDLRQAQGALPEARLQRELLDEQIALTRNALAALVGAPNMPLALTYKAQAAIMLVPLDKLISANLLSQRADVTAALWRAQAADQGISAARAQFYPNINLNAFAGFSSIGLGQLLQSGSQQWGVGPAISLPLFDSGRLRANLGVKTAERDAAVESYNATVINAIHDVADQLASRQAIARQQAEQAQAAQAAQETYDATQQRYRSGLLNALQVLNAETAVLAQRRQAADLSTRALQNQVALARALGGGFTATTPPADRETLSLK